MTQASWQPSVRIIEKPQRTLGLSPVTAELAADLLMDAAELEKIRDLLWERHPGIPVIKSVFGMVNQLRGPRVISLIRVDGGAVNGLGKKLGASLAALTTVQTDGSLVFTSPPAQARKLAAGDVVTAGVSAATPQGFLGQVTSVSAVGSTVTVATAPASLDQALSSAGFGIKSALGRGQVASFTPSRSGTRLRPAAGSTADCPAPEISLSLINTDLYKDSNGRAVTVDGGICMSPHHPPHKSSSALQRCWSADSVFHNRSDPGAGRAGHLRAERHACRYVRSPLRSSGSGSSAPSSSRKLATSQVIVAPWRDRYSPTCRMPNSSS